MSEYVVIYEQAANGGWGAYLPNLPGVVAIGVSRAEAAQRIQEALNAYAEHLRARQAAPSTPPRGRNCRHVDAVRVVDRPRERDSAVELIDSQPSDRRARRKLLPEPTPVALPL